MKSEIAFLSCKYRLTTLVNNQKIYLYKLPDRKDTL